MASGIRESYLVGALGAVSASVVGMALGFAAGWRGGILDEVLQMVTNIIVMLPSLVLLVVIGSYLNSRSVLFEGAQGTFLDIDFGTYPFVTSSNTTAGGSCTGTGVPPTSIDTVIGITKAYCTRVGGGPFPTELLGAEGEDLRKRGNEYGAVTGRPRRTGWLDLPLLRYAGMINGISWLVVTKLDVLDHLTEIPVCVGYKVDGKATDEIPAQACGYEKLECIYRSMPGWATPTQSIRTLEGLPKAARDYMAFIETET